MADQNNAFQKNKVNTSGLTLFDENGVMLKMGYLDDSLSLVIGEPKVADNGKKSYPDELRNPFIITLDRANALLQDIIIKKVLPALEAGDNYNGGVFLNRRKDSIFEIRVQDGDIYLVYYKEIGEDRTPKSTHVFKCQKTQLIEKYSSDGSSTFEQTNVDGYFMIFYKYLEAGIFDMGNSSTHSYRKANYYVTQKIFNYLEGICAKMGVTIENRSHYQPSNSGFMDIPDGSDEELPFQAAPVTTSLDGLLS